VKKEAEADEQEDFQSDELSSVQEKIAEIVRRLELVKTESELDVLTDNLLYGADLVRFIDYLPPEPPDAEVDADDISLDDTEHEGQQEEFDNLEETE